MLLLNFVARPGNGHDLYVVMAALKLIDDWMIIPAAVGSLITGLMFSMLTPWGFFKWRWVTVKWIVTIIMTLFGVFYLSPWLHEMAAITVSDPAGALQNETFIANQRMLSLSGGPMFVAMFFLIFVSVIKPWSGRAKGLCRPAAQREAPEQPSGSDVDDSRRRGLGQFGVQPIQLSDSVDSVPGRQPGGALPQIGSDHQRIARDSGGRASL
jgi:hypothetical protein